MPDKQTKILNRIASSLRDLRERHRERHRPSGFRFAFADGIDYLHPELWDAVASKGSIFLRREILRVIEQNGPDNIEPRYALICRAEMPVAVLAAQIVGVTGAQLVREKGRSERPSPLLKRVVTPAAKVASANFKERMLVGGNLLSWGFHGVAFAGDEREVWPAVAEALYRIRRAARLSGETNIVMLKDVTAAQNGLEALRRFSYRPLETEPNMVLQIDPSWQTYDDYLVDLDSKWEEHAKDQVKKLTAANCRVERLHDIASQAERLHELSLSVHANSSIRLVTLPERYLPALANAAGENFRCHVVCRAEEIVGFVTT